MPERESRIDGPAMQARQYSRRHLMGGVRGATGAMALGVGIRGVWPAAAQVATPETLPLATPVVGAPFVESPVLRGIDGRLDITMTAQLGPTEPGRCM